MNYLIAHKVRGEPAFDVAIQMQCPCCREWDDEPGQWCDECGNDKYWWIIPTSGHRAYPYWYANILVSDERVTVPMSGVRPMPEGWVDHYPPSEEPAKSLPPILTLLAKIGIGPKMDRRL